MRIVPITRKEAREFTNQHHRHNKGSKGHKFSIGLEDNGELVGIATVGYPIARHMNDGRTAEVTRVCTIENNKNANSRLYGAACRACKAMGFESVITYTLKSESGSSLLASGFFKEAEVVPHKNGWNSNGRKRDDLEIYHVGKYRWRRYLCAERDQYHSHTE